MKRVAVTLATVLYTAAIARGQPLPDVPIPPDEPSGDPKPPIPPSGDNPLHPDGTQPATPPVPAQHTEDDANPADPHPPAAPAKPAKPLPPLFMPEVLTTPTGWLLPAAVMYSKTAIDTGGGISSDTRVGLGDVA